MNKLLENEKLFQATNQHLVEITSQLAPTDFPRDLEMELYCECANKACEERLSIACGDYVVIAEDSNSFAVKPEHYLPEFERILRQTAQYWVIAKRPEKLDKPFQV